MEQNLPAVGAPVQPSVRPRAWADDKVMAGQVGNCASDAAKTYWQRSNQFDRMMAERLRHPLYAPGDLRAPLTDEKIADVIREATGWTAPDSAFFNLARAIERAHGIGA